MFQTAPAPGFIPGTPPRDIVLFPGATAAGDTVAVAASSAPTASVLACV